MMVPMPTEQALTAADAERITRLYTPDAPAFRVLVPADTGRSLLADVLDYQRARRTRQYEMLADTAVDLDNEDDPSEVARMLKETRRAVGARRRATDH